MVYYPMIPWTGIAEWKNIKGKPYITVSAKGIANGLSDIPNDGADFGPDTPGTQTYGIREAVNYASSTGINKVKLLAGTYTWLSLSTTNSLTPSVSIPAGVTVEGEGIDKTIIKINDSTLHYEIPFLMNSNTRITGMTFDMAWNTNQYYTPSAIFINNPSDNVEIDHCKFIHQATAWFIQTQPTFNSTSPPSNYITNVFIHDNIINANILNGTSANEAIVMSNAKYIRIYDNYFYTNTSTTTMNNGFFSIYDYTRHTSVFNNLFEILPSAPGHDPLMNVSDTYDFHFFGNKIVSALNVSTGIGTIIGIQNSSKYVYIEGNTAIGIISQNNVTFNAFVAFGLGPNAVANGPGGPDGNVSQNSGWNDYIVIKNNYVIGVFGLLKFFFSGNQNFTYLEISDNVFGTLRTWRNPLQYASQNNGTIIIRNNIEIGDIIVGSSNVGNAGYILSIAPPSGYIAKNVIIEGNRFFNGTDFASTTVFNNITLQNINNLVFRNNIMYNNSTISSPTTVAPWYQLSNITTPIVGPNYDGASGKVLEQMFPLSSVAGTTAGTVNIYAMNFYETKKYIIMLSGYENNTTTNQTINFPIAFSSYAVITANNTGLTISASTTGITITSPNSTTTYSGIVIVEGY
jgi:hypothetical protein